MKPFGEVGLHSLHRVQHLGQIDRKKALVDRTLELHWVVSVQRFRKSPLQGRQEHSQEYLEQENMISLWLAVELNVLADQNLQFVPQTPQYPHAAQLAVAQASASSSRAAYSQQEELQAEEVVLLHQLDQAIVKTVVHVVVQMWLHVRLRAPLLVQVTWRSCAQKGRQRCPHKQSELGLVILNSVDELAEVLQPWIQPGSALWSWKWMRRV